MERYLTNFIENGYDNQTVIRSLDETDLDVMAITLPGHRKLLLQSVSQ